MARPRARLQEAGQRVTQRKELCTKARLRDQAQLRGFKMPESSLRILVNKLRKDLHKCLESMEIPPAALLTKRQLTHVLQALRLFRPRDAHSHPKYKDCLEDKLLTKYAVARSWWSGAVSSESTREPDP